MNTFGDRFRTARSDLGLTQDEMAELLEVSKSAISAWENNREAPAFEKLPRIRQHTGVSLDMLVCGLAPSAWRTGARIADGAAHAWATAPKQDTTTRDELRLLRRFRAMNERKRKALIIVLDGADER